MTKLFVIAQRENYKQLCNTSKMTVLYTMSKKTNICVQPKEQQVMFHKLCPVTIMANVVAALLPTCVKVI